MKNKLGDLNNHLFAELERLSDEDLRGEELDTEIRRAKALTGVASQIIQSDHSIMNRRKLRGRDRDTMEMGVATSKIIRKLAEIDNR